MFTLSSSLLFHRYTDTGFTVSGVQYEGSLLCVGNVLLSWGPKKLSEITADRYITIFFLICINTLFCNCHI